MAVINPIKPGADQYNNGGKSFADEVKNHSSDDIIKNLSENRDKFAPAQIQAMLKELETRSGHDGQGISDSERELLDKLKKGPLDKDEQTSLKSAMPETSTDTKSKNEKTLESWDTNTLLDKLEKGQSKLSGADLSMFMKELLDRAGQDGKIDPAELKQINDIMYKAADGKLTSADTAALRKLLPEKSDGTEFDIK